MTNNFSDATMMTSFVEASKDDIALPTSIAGLWGWLLPTRLPRACSPSQRLLRRI